MSIKPLNHHEILVVLSTLQDQSLLQIHYPPEDRNEKSRSAVAHSLRDSGYQEMAQAIDNGVQFVTVDSVVEAVKIREVIESHSVALSAHLYWKGLENDQVNDALLEVKNRQDYEHSHPKFGATRHA